IKTSSSSESRSSGSNGLLGCDLTALRHRAHPRPRKTIGAMHSSRPRPVSSSRLDQLLVLESAMVVSTRARFEVLSLVDAAALPIAVRVTQAVQVLIELSIAAGRVGTLLKSIPISLAVASDPFRTTYRRSRPKAARARLPVH